jgi:protocatechuate 3,4-dioxygenase alpha subunit
VLPLTPSQTVGPFFHVAVPYRAQETIAGPEASGQRIVIDGSIRDGQGKPVPDGLVEIWQADHAGRSPHPEHPERSKADAAFTGFGRIPTDDQGRFVLETIKPGRVAGPEGRLQSPHLLVSVFARGLLDRLVTRIYFDDEPANALDPILACVPPDRRSTLLARSAGDGRYRFDIVLQGVGETVFFDV